MPHIVIIDYGSGNLRSAAKAFERVADGRAVITVTSDSNALEDATHIVLPGVGAFADCMRGLEAARGMRSALEKQVLEQKKPFLGVCVGMQMLFDTGHEHGMHKGLGWIAGEVVRIAGVTGDREAGDWGTGERGTEADIPLSPPLSPSYSPNLKIPHIGWNDLHIQKPGHPLLKNIAAGDHAYFVHSYHAVVSDAYVLATTEYGGAMTAIVARGNIIGTQFHPEKSQKTGLTLIENFLSFRP